MEKKIKLASIISDDMVLQMSEENCIFGKVYGVNNISAEFNGKVYEGTIKGNDFEIILPKMDKGGPYTLIVKGDELVEEINNVYIGRVFMFSGQSNMEWRVNDSIWLGKQYLKFGNYVPGKDDDPETFPYYNENEEIKEQYRNIIKNNLKSFKNLRIFNMVNTYNFMNIVGNVNPQDDVLASWRRGTVDNMLDFSLFAYYFLKNYLEKYTDVMVGCVEAAVGATSVLTWTRKEVYERDKDHYFYGNFNGNPTFESAARCYNTFIAPTLKYTIEAFIWYQGCGQARDYNYTLVNMINDLKEQKLNGNFNTLIVGLPLYGDSLVLPDGEKSFDFLRNKDKETGLVGELYYNCRKEHRIAAEKLDKAAFVSNINNGDYDDIHPSDKYVIGYQSFCKYIKEFYDEKGILDGPTIKNVRFENDGVYISFNLFGSSLVVKNKGRNFLVFENNEWIQKNCEQIGDEIVVKGNNITAIKYGILVYPRITRLDCSKYVSLFNKEGFPVDQFEFTK